jgi:exosome complex RNA-binding protein Csl4
MNLEQNRTITVEKYKNRAKISLSNVRSLGVIFALCRQCKLEVPGNDIIYGGMYFQHD